MNNSFVRDIHEAAKSDKYFDKYNAKIIANDHGVFPGFVLREIRSERKRLNDPEADSY